jgi:hypothetical protein
LCADGSGFDVRLVAHRRQRSGTNWSSDAEDTAAAEVRLHNLEDQAAAVTLEAEAREREAAALRLQAQIRRHLASGARGVKSTRSVKADRPAAADVGVDSPGAGDGGAADLGSPLASDGYGGAAMASPTVADLEAEADAAERLADARRHDAAALRIQCQVRRRHAASSVARRRGKGSDSAGGDTSADTEDKGHHAQRQGHGVAASRRAEAARREREQNVMERMKAEATAACSRRRRGSRRPPRCASRARCGVELRSDWRQSCAVTVPRRCTHKRTSWRPQPPLPRSKQKRSTRKSRRSRSSAFRFALLCPCRVVAPPPTSRRIM